MYPIYPWLIQHLGNENYLRSLFFSTYLYSGCLTYLFSIWHRFNAKQAFFIGLTVTTSFALADAVVSLLIELILPPIYALWQFIGVQILTTLLLKLGVIIVLKKMLQKQAIYLATLDHTSLLILGILAIYAITALFIIRSRQLQGLIQFHEQAFLIAGLVVFQATITLLYLNLTRYFHQLGKNRITMQTYQGELRYLKSQRQNQQELRRLRHDLKNQYLVLAGLLENPANLQEAQNYLKKLTAATETKEKYFTPHFALNYLLNQKLNQAQQNQITLTISVFLPADLKIDPDILAMIVGNLLDNAISAAQRQRDPDLKKIKFTLKAFQHNIKLNLINYFDPKELQTRAQKRHDGLGIKTIKRAVAAANGIYEQTSHDDVYQTTIIFLNSYPLTTAPT